MPPATGGRAAPTQALSAPRRRSAAASTDSSCAPVLNVPLASTVPSRAERDRERAAGHVGQRPRAGVLGLVEAAHGDPRVAREGVDAGASAWQMRQPSEVKTASPSRPSPSSPPKPRPARCARRPPGPRSAISSAPCGPIDIRSEPSSRASASTRDAERDHAREREAEPDREPLVGGQRPRGPAAAAPRRRRPAARRGRSRRG